MWIPNINDWNKSHTELSKYFIERIKQKVDPTELISNKHRTSNGYTLIAEIINVAENSLKRERTVSRLISLIEEATTKQLSFTIPNDYILKKHYTDIIDYYNGINRSTIKENEGFIRTLIIKSKIYLSRLDEGYYDKIGKEIQSIDFSSKDFVRNADVIDSIIDCMIPLLLFNGYSTTSIDEISYRYVFKDNGIQSARKIYHHFSGRLSDYKILIKYWSSATETEGIFNFLNEKSIEYKRVTFDEVKEDLKLIRNFEIKDGDELIEIKHTNIDPHNFIREIYDRGLKKYVSSADRLELGYFTHFFDNVYWRFSKAVGARRHLYNETNHDLDPINVPTRGSTLRYTLVKSTIDWRTPHKEGDKLPDISLLSQPTYFYNLALGSKSIENSLFLLWTSIETMVPYRLHKSDIENVQHFVSSSLGFGSIIRELSSFIIRFAETSKVNKTAFKDFDNKQKYYNHTVTNLIEWSKWLGTKYEQNDPNDPYLKIQPISNLLCRQYCHLNDLYAGNGINTAKYFQDKIESSELAIKYQLDRIYLHRNQIVHSGKFLTEYSNLWSNLEWYVGKLLSYAYLKHMKSGAKYSSLEEVFMELEADSQQIKSIVKNNSNKPTTELGQHYETLLKHTWQGF